MTTTKYSYCSKIECLYFEEIDKFNLKDIYEDSKSVYRALFSHNQDYLRIEIRSDVKQETADRYINAQITRMKALFENTRSPYPGEISDTISCDEKFKPDIKSDLINGINVTHFSGFLNNRMTYGACTDDQAEYRGVFTLFYCQKQNKLYQLEIFSPKEFYEANQPKYNSILNSIRCN